MCVYDFLAFVQQVQLYHWFTSSYARHKGAQQLYEQSQSLLDQFMEVYTGQYNSKPPKPCKLPISVPTDASILKVLDHMIKHLHACPCISEKDTHLTNLRDEWLSVLYQTKYLFRLE